MKTPREVLLARHRAAEPQLDAIRKEVIAATLQAPHSACESLLAIGWRELFWSCRRAWLGLAAVWVAIVALNFASADAPRAGRATLAASGPDVLEAWKERQQLLAELTEPKPEPAEPPKRTAPGPHSERRRAWMIG